MKLPQLVIFDMDGLIFDTERLFMSKIHTVLREYGYPAREEDYVQTIGLAGEQLHHKLLELFGPSYPADEISGKARAAVNQYMESHGPDLKPGIETLLSWLKSRQIPCCVASSTHSSYVRKYLKLAGLEDFFSFVIGGEATTRSKPAPDIFLTACARAHVEPENALVLEDSENGIRASLAANIPVVCIPDLKQPDPQLASQTALLLSSADQLTSHFVK